MLDHKLILIPVIDLGALFSKKVVVVSVKFYPLSGSTPHVPLTTHGRGT